jgi:hypothetical protein
MIYRVTLLYMELEAPFKKPVVLDSCARNQY